MRSLNTKDQLIKNPAGRIKFRKFRAEGYEHYHIGVWLDETDSFLDRVEFVEYELHHSFRNRVRKSASRSNKFSVTFWAWGGFDINVRVHLRNGEVIRRIHKLDFRLPDDTGNNYVDVGETG